MKRQRRRINTAVNTEIGRLHKAEALLIAMVCAANHEVQFDAADGMAVILTMVEQTLQELDQLEVEL